MTNQNLNHCMICWSLNLNACCETSLEICISCADVALKWGNQKYLEYIFHTPFNNALQRNPTYFYKRQQYVNIFSTLMQFLLRPFMDILSKLILGGQFMTTIFQNVTFIYTKSTLILKACVGWLTDDKSGAFYFAQKDPIYLMYYFVKKVILFLSIQ